MGHPDIVLKAIVFMNVKLVDVESDVVSKVTLYMDAKLVYVEVDVSK